MIRWILLAVLVVGISAAIPIVLSALPTDSNGAVVFQPVSERIGPVGELLVEGKPEYDFGDMAQQSEGKHEWVVKNVGPGDLELNKGSSTCMCTVADFSPDPETGEVHEKIVLKPGEETKITLTWKTKDSNGRFEKSASILSSDPEHPEFWFRIMRRGAAGDRHAADRARLRLRQHLQQGALASQVGPDLARQARFQDPLDLLQPSRADRDQFTPAERTRRRRNSDTRAATASISPSSRRRNWAPSARS